MVDVVKQCLDFLSSHKLIVGTAAAGLTCLWYCYRPLNMPPGPWGWPFVGSQFSLGHAEHLTVTQLKHKYGDILTLWFGGNRYQVYVNSYDYMQEFLVTHSKAFVHRDQEEIYSCWGIKDDIFSAENTPSHNRIRKLTLRSLRNTGLSDGRWNTTMGVEFDKMADSLVKSAGQPINMFLEAATNHTCALFFNKQDLLPGRGNEALVKLLKGQYREILQNFSRARYPYPIQYLYRYIMKRRFQPLVGPIMDAICDVIKEHVETFDASNIRDMCDAFINAGEIDRRGIYQTAQNIGILMPDPTMTTSGVLSWIVVFLVKHSNYQQMIFDEIEGVFREDHMGSSLHSHVTLDMKSRLPLTRAVVDEVLRMTGSVLTFTFGQHSKEDVQVGKFLIPKETKVYFNLYSVGRDAAKYPDPHQFYPERFLDVPSDETSQHAAPHLAFSIGARSCVGELLARNFLFFFLANFVHRFLVDLAPGETLPNTEALEPDMVFSGSPVQFIIKPRNK